MLYDVIISENQFINLKNSNSGIIFLQYSETFQSIKFFDFLEIHTYTVNNPPILARVCLYESFENNHQLFNSQIFQQKVLANYKQFFQDEINKLFESNLKVFAFVIEAYLLQDENNLSIVPITLLMYEKIMWLRYLPVKIIKNEVWKIVNDIEYTLDYLIKKIDFTEYINKLSKSDSYEGQSIINLLEKYNEINNIDDFRMNLINELITAINQIKICLSNNIYKNIKRIAYNIHNHPQNIR